MNGTCSYRRTLLIGSQQVILGVWTAWPCTCTLVTGFLSPASVIWPLFHSLVGTFVPMVWLQLVAHIQLLLQAWGNGYQAPLLGGIHLLPLDSNLPHVVYIPMTLRSGHSGL